MFTWAQKRQFTVLIIFLVAAILIFGWLFFYFFGENEETGDVLNARDFSILWARFFKLRDGFIDLAALVENPNDFSAGKFKYSFKVYDQNNILISIKEGESYAGPKEKFVLFEPKVAVFQRTPFRVILDIEDMVWEKNFKKESPLIDILGTEKFLEDVSPHLSLKIKNRGQKTYENIETAVVLWKNENEAVGVSRTIISNLNIEEERLINFTWPEPINGILRVEAFFRLQ